MSSTSDWADTGQIFLIRNREIDWSTGRPVWTRNTHDEQGRYVQRRYLVDVTMTLIEEAR